MNPPTLEPHMTPNDPVRLDDDPQETREWLDSIESVLSTEGRPRAHYLIDQLLDFDVARHGDFYGRVTTPYVNTIPVERQLPYPGNQAIERRTNAFIRWNAMAMVLRAGKHSGVGGHIATYASAAVLYDVGFDHFSVAEPTHSTATWCISRAIPHQAFMAVPTWRAVSAKRSWITFVARPVARVCLPTLTHG